MYHAFYKLCQCSVGFRNTTSVEIFKGKLKTWFTKTWFPHIRKWCLAYRPDDSPKWVCKVRYFSGNKNCSLNEILSVVITSFIPEHYQKYADMNIRCGNGCKKYAPSIPEFLRNRSKQIVEILLNKTYRVTDGISLTKLDNLWRYQCWRKQETS